MVLQFAEADVEQVPVDRGLEALVLIHGDDLVAAFPEGLHSAAESDERIKHAEGFSHRRGSPGCRRGALGSAGS